MNSIQNPIKSLYNRALEHVEHYNRSIAPTHYKVVANRSFSFQPDLEIEYKKQLKYSTFPEKLVKIVDLTYEGLEIILKPIEKENSNKN
jgi:hypothetical protein